MSTLIDSVADATRHRDRDRLEEAVARLLYDALEAETVAVYRLLLDGATSRVQRRLGLRRGCAELGEDSADVAQLPDLSAVPAWRECATTRDAVHYVDAIGCWHSVFPLCGETDVVGLLEIAGGAKELPTRDVRLAAGVLRIVRNHLAVLDYGERDTLTGLLNRKTFEAGFAKLRARQGCAAGEPAWLGVVDIDRFKSINDHYGHLFGDEVLLLVSQLLRASFRGADQLYRFGGEEFVVVLDHASAAGADTAFGRLRTAIESYRFPQVGTVTVSVGYTRVLASDAPASAFERADAALYYAKHNGRNRALGYEQLIADGCIERKETRADVELF